MSDIMEASTGAPTDVPEAVVHSWYSVTRKSSTRNETSG